MSFAAWARRPIQAGAAPLSPRRKWRAITLATLLLVPAYWSVLLGLVSMAVEEPGGAANAGAFIAFGLCLVPFVFVALAFLSEHPNPPQAVLKAMAVALLVGIPVSAIAADAVTGFVAAIGAGGVAALRADLSHSWKARALGVLVATAYTFLMVRLAGDLVLIVAPAFPLSAIGVADHLSERRRERTAAAR
jgi:hypothetical protein